MQQGSGLRLPLCRNRCRKHAPLFSSWVVLYSQQESSANNNFQFYQQLAIIIQQYNVQILNSRREPREHRKGYQSSYRQSDKRMTLAPPKLLMQLRFVCCLASKSQIKMINFNSAGYALGIQICGCSVFYKRELWASKSAGAHSTKSLKISGCKR